MLRHAKAGLPVVIYREGRAVWVMPQDLSLGLSPRDQTQNESKVMKRVPVTSTAIVSVGYDAATRVLELKFVDGDVYQYRDVPSDTHLALMDAESIGTFVNTVLKPKFEGKRIPTS